MSLIAASASPAPLVDEHSVLLWQVCAHADELSEAVGSEADFTAALHGMLTFLHYRLLPYLLAEESRLQPAQLRDGHMARLLVTDHQRLRSGVENLESSRTRGLASLAAAALANQLDRHLRREESWVVDARAGSDSGVDIEDWEVLLRFSDAVDMDSLPTSSGEDLVLRRLQAMRYGETLRLQATRNLHDLWRRHQAIDPGSHAWVYEEDGPTRWDVRVTRRNRRTC
jgi:uncharacterized protein (DUF2249 family)